MTLDLDTPWVEKYRPRNFNEIVSQNIAINNLKEFVLSGNMPHMIFTGPAGTGKTSTALIIARTLLKDDLYYRNLLELNASDTVRMQFVRNILKPFTNQKMIIDNNSLKIVILDEADNIPAQVQQALRRIIEKASTKVKFLLMCNYVNKVIDPIISRCAVFRFVSLSKEKIVERLKYIVSQENLQIPKEKEENFFNTLYFISSGDLRKAINTLQMSVALELLENLDINEILKISGFVDNSILDSLIKAFQIRNFTSARKVLNSIEFLDGRNFIRQIIAVIPRINALDLKDLNHLIAFSGEIDYRISQGADTRIQLLALLAEIIKKIKKKIK